MKCQQIKSPSFQKVESIRECRLQCGSPTGKRVLVHRQVDTSQISLHPSGHSPQSPLRVPPSHSPSTQLFPSCTSEASSCSRAGSWWCVRSPRWSICIQQGLWGRLRTLPQVSHQFCPKLPPQLRLDAESALGLWVDGLQQVGNSWESGGKWSERVCFFVCEESA